MTAAARLAALDSLPAEELCNMAELALASLVNVMNEETTLLRAGHMRQAGTLTPEKTRLAQDYVGFARSVQRQSARLKLQAPDAIERLRLGHERLATQMAENLRVLATARMVTEDILTDVAKVVGQQNRAKTYGRAGTITVDPGSSARGIAINRAL
ncbi:MAG: flagellar protein FlgN [Alphaproteobacteria bacterium]|nr:flagellar protein FlgN [Alphaproteobacteria bacterium]MBU1559384.1 flagellar protein FlgN [Alphaproteobacteria bacterium]MBU2301436.1 flagellar protein FlgN [Alphaproteobacteria bacterium]MBU2369661.1 flagellar protein FlgN [Alphaproteobacteria bacterium]